MFSEGLSISSGSLMLCDADMLLVAFGASAVSCTEQFGGKDFYSVWKAFVIDSEGCGYLGQSFPGKCSQVECLPCWGHGGQNAGPRVTGERKQGDGEEPQEGLEQKGDVT